MNDAEVLWYRDFAGLMGTVQVEKSSYRDLRERENVHSFADRPGNLAVHRRKQCLAFSRV
jgi:hypothetical protein